eukprot:CAMPEP_0172529350 /NCGR_PEP_ID=MMETSP1067-20121228/3454_1 /TAXON_ID=265564 ORGANISM="Thalassiosira punctigera, Strain Tpunct2005C2" /NCGR_SAMPLE_ID=MMETSP1067 /ASSEMBLY_ACC=CAM_ASM_000444 /LENGTH=161 /DNA_ID=CAMNT_0013313383 /DNA_START=156 /DNA_END=637 /DNA_ORIENTATION=-
MSYHTPDSKKEEFRRYLERSGAIDSLTSVLVGLYEENDRPSESTDYIKRYLGGGGGGGGGPDVGGGGGPAVVGGGGGGGGGNADAKHNRGSAAGATLATSQRGEQECEKLRKENRDLRNQVKEQNRTIETLRANLKHSREEAKRARMQRDQREGQQPGGGG